MLSGNGLAWFCFLNLWLNFMEIRRCAIPSRATLLVGRGVGEAFACLAWFAVGNFSAFFNSRQFVQFVSVHPSSSAVIAKA